MRAVYWCFYKRNKELLNNNINEDTLYNLLKLYDKKYNNLVKNVKNNNINLQVHYIPIHLQPYYRKNYGFKNGDFPVAEKFYEKEITLPIYFSLKEHQIYKTIKLIKKLIL